MWSLWLHVKQPSCIQRQSILETHFIPMGHWPCSRFFDREVWSVLKAYMHTMTWMWVFRGLFIMENTNCSETSAADSSWCTLMSVSMFFAVASSQPPTRIVAAKAADAYTTEVKAKVYKKCMTMMREGAFVGRRTLISEWILQESRLILYKLSSLLLSILGSCSLLYK